MSDTRPTPAGRAAPKHVDRPHLERLARRLVVAVVIALVIAIVAAALAVEANRRADSNAAGKDHAQGQARTLYSQAASAGATPSVTPSGVAPASIIAGPTGAQGATGPGPSSSEIAAAVRLYCADHAGCTGVPSPAQVVSAVRAFCSTGVCRGTAGASGSPGPSGAAGASGAPGASGAAGTGPSDDQIRAAVSAYCAAHGDCTGPAGPKGDTGSTGPAGRGITSIDCSGLGVDQLVIHYDDGTEQTVPCAGAQPASSTP